jgi:hypothetical protein
VQNIPFIIGIQTCWMHSMMVTHSHNNVMSMDSTFSTNMYGVCIITPFHFFMVIKMNSYVLNIIFILMFFECSIN